MPSPMPNSLQHDTPPVVGWTQPQREQAPMPQRPSMPQAFLLHQPSLPAAVVSSSAVSTPGRSLLSTLSAAIATQNDGFDAADEDPCVVPWDEVIAAVVGDARERAAALVMQQRGPLSGSAVPCTVVVHHDKVLEITVATHRTGILPLHAAPHDGASVGSRGRRRLVIPVASIAAISSDLPPVARSGGEGGLDDHLGDPSYRSGTTAVGSGTPSYGVEISGSPMRALRITFQLHHDVAQRLADWSAPSKLGRSADHHDTRLRPRFVVLYGTSMVEAQRWRLYLQYLCRANLTEAFGRSPNDRAAANKLRQSLGDDPGGGDTTGDGGDSEREVTARREDPAAATGHATDIKVLTEVGAPTPAHAAWHWSTCFGRPWPTNVTDSLQLPSLDAQHRMSTLRRCTGYGVWCPFGHEWLKRIHDDVVEDAARQTALREQRLDEEVDDAEVLIDGTPWVVTAHGGSTLHDNVERSQRMKMELLWRLSKLRHTTTTAIAAPGGTMRAAAAGDEADSSSSSPLGWLDARAKFMTPAQFETHTAQKYLDVEEAMGNIIDTIASRMSKGTGIAF